MEKALSSKALIIDNHGIKHYLDNIENFIYHDECLDEYIEDNYPNEDIFLKLNENNSRHMYVYCLTSLGNIVYLNGGSYGSIYIPNNMNDVQKTSLYELLPELKNQPITFAYNMEEINGVVYFNMMEPADDHTLSQTVDEYFKSRKTR